MGWFRRVLIETLWNVKFYGLEISCLSAIGINRNIVECKDLLFSPRMSRLLCINRNIVECKEVRDVQAADWMGRINRNIVECKVTDV